MSDHIPMSFGGPTFDVICQADGQPWPCDQATPADPSTDNGADPTPPAEDASGQPADPTPVAVDDGTTGSDPAFAASITSDTPPDPTPTDSGQGA